MVGVMDYRKQPKEIRGMSKCKQAQSHEQQIAELKDSRLPKTEREHAAVREIERLEQRLAAANGRLEEYEEKTCNCRWEGETLVRQCELHEAHVDAIHEWAERAKVAEQRLAEAEKALRWACDVYIVDDHYTGDLRKERLERAVNYAMKRGNLKKQDEVSE